LDFLTDRVAYFVMKHTTTSSQKPVSPESLSRPQDALGQSEAFLNLQEQLSRVAPIDRPVLLLGERGTGKELAAARIHFLSKRWKGPLVALNCSALAPSLIESELFGYEKGAFTGAERRRTGRFEAAHGGTLFLDEIGNMPLEVQEKTLRLVEYGTFERVGSSESIEADVRLVAATNADLVERTREGRFKADLLDRLSFEVVFLPPLRERAEDIPLLANHFAARMAFEMERHETPVFAPETLGSLESYSWPGNIRELKNVVERAVYRTDDPVIRDIVFDPFEEFPVKGDSANAPMPSPHLKTSVVNELLKMPLQEAVLELKVRMLNRALRMARHNQKEAAERLGLTYHQFRGLYRSMKDRIE
jgi:psp operon transcriptional activator